MLFYILISLFGICLIIQFYYYLNYFKALEQFENEKLTILNPKVSVIICAHNEEKHINEMVVSVLKQDYDDFEVIVVNDRSTDQTSEILKGTSDPRLTIINVSEVSKGVSPKKNALSLGFASMKGDFALLTDADCVAKSHQWISKMIGCLKDSTDLVLGYSPYEVRSGLLNKLIQYDTFLTAIQYLSFAIKNKATMGVGRNLLIRKSAFDGVNGFEGYEQVIAGDDDIIVQKIAGNSNVEVCIDKESFMHSKPEKTWKAWYKQKRRHLSVGLEYSFGNKLLAGMFQQSSIWLYILFIALLVMFGTEKVAWLLVGIMIMRLMIFYGSLRKKLNFNLYIYVLPILEIFYLLNIIIIGVSVIVRRKRKWN